MKLDKNPKLWESLVNMIRDAHKYFRKSDDISTVSLRDIKRYLKIFIWINESYN